MKMYLYTLSLEYEDRWDPSSELLGIFNDFGKIKEEILKHCNYESWFSLDMKQLENLDVDKNIKVYLRPNSTCHYIEITKYTLNNDSSFLYEPGSEIYNVCQAKVTQLSKS